jgi:pantothenate kinase
VIAATSDKFAIGVCVAVSAGKSAFQRMLRLLAPRATKLELRSLAAKDLPD